MGVLSCHNHLRRTVSLVGRLRMTSSVISPQLTPMDPNDIWMCLAGLVSSGKKIRFGIQFPFAQESTEEKFPWLQLRKQVLQQMGSLVFGQFFRKGCHVYRISKSTVVFQTFCWVEREKMVWMFLKIQHWKHSQGWRNSCTHGGYLIQFRFIHLWMFYLIISRFFVTSRKKNMGEVDV